MVQNPLGQHFGNESLRNLNHDSDYDALYGFNYSRAFVHGGTFDADYIQEWLYNGDSDNYQGPVAPAGQSQITVTGTTLFTVPSGVNSVSAVCVGGGGGAAGTGSNRGGSGGGGGGLAWATIPVTPGEVLTVEVGRGGDGTSSSSTGNPGVASSIGQGGTIVLQGGGGGGGLTALSSGTNQAGRFGAGGVSSGTLRQGGGSGGRGGLASYNNAGGAGGGAGGYSGNGGAGAYSNSNTGGSAGSGGGGSGGTCISSACGGGGGVGILGEGASGGLPGSGQGGNGGSGGANGSVGNSNSNGGLYGGGGGADDDDYTGFGGDGADGAVRIIWGADRAYPATNTGNV